MWPESPSSLITSQTVKMLAIMQQWDGERGYYTDYTGTYLLLVLFKSGLDTGVFYLCCRKWNTSFLSMCSLSIALADLVMVFFMASAWFLGAERSFVSPCFLLAAASATYGALPLPMLCLGLMDYCLEDTASCNHRAFCKSLRNMVMTCLVWTLAGVCSFGSVNAELTELDNSAGEKLQVCEVEESVLISYLTVGLFAAVLFPMLPFWSRIPQWVKEADRLSKAREQQKNERSDLLFTSTPRTETKCDEESYPDETIQSRPPLWFSLTLGFGIFWTPYLALSVACLVFGFEVPAYISVNLLWLECTNSLLAGVVFWVKSKTLGPYSNLPENVCLWHVYWHLSKGVQHQQLPVAVFNPSKGKRNTLLYA